MKRSDQIRTPDGVTLHYDEYGAGERIVISAQAGFAPAGLQQALAGEG